MSGEWLCLLCYLLGLLWGWLPTIQWPQSVIMSVSVMVFNDSLLSATSLTNSLTEMNEWCYWQSLYGHWLKRWLLSFKSSIQGMISWISSLTNYVKWTISLDDNWSEKRSTRQRLTMALTKQFNAIILHTYSGYQNISGPNLYRNWEKFLCLNCRLKRLEVFWKKFR